MKIRTLIIEDELPAQRILKTYIKDLPQLELVACFNNALEAMSFLQQQSVDLILLDINLPKLSGLDFLKVMPDAPQIILTTAYSEYALEGFELDVVDYLLKPFSFQRFVKAIQKIKLMKSPIITANIPAKTKDTIDHFFIKVDKVFYKVVLANILYLKAEKDFVRIFSKNTRQMVLQTLKYYETTLPTSQFIRVHKSYIINLQKIEMVFGNIVRINGEDIPIGRSYKERLIQRLSLN